MIFALEFTNMKLEYKVIVENGETIWYLDNQYHREGGPAIEHVNGYKAYFRRGKLHREDGPAVEYVCGSKLWYLNGILLTEAEFNAKIRNHDGNIIVIDGKNYKLSLVEQQNKKNEYSN